MGFKILCTGDAKQGQAWVCELERERHVWLCFASSRMMLLQGGNRIKVTHEAAIGSVDTRQLETLMARGVGPETAVDILVRGMLSPQEFGRQPTP